jgi:hypothetical protein
VPDEVVGQTKVGVVSAIIRKGRVKFGFINFGNGPEIDEAAPRIYFSFTNVAEADTVIRRGYIVTFKVAKDETGRPFADGVTLTAEGKVIAAAREIEVTQRRAERKEGDAPKAERAPRERKPVEDKFVNLSVTCEGKTGAKTIQFNAAQSIGKLKNIATTEFEAPVEYNVFHVTAENPDGVFLTKAILNTLAENSKIHLAAPKATEA